MGGDNEGNVKKQVVVHLTLQEYKVSVTISGMRATGFHRQAKPF